MGFNSVDKKKVCAESAFRAVGIAMVKNEADVIEAFVRCNLRFLDSLVVLDNNSSDRTRDILASLMAEGLPLILLDDPDPTYAQSRKTTALLYAVARTMSPRWIIPLDADEFLLPSGGADLVSSLDRIEKDTIGLLYWRTYVPTGHDGLDQVNVLERITRRRNAERNDVYKIAIPRSLYSKAPVIVAQGNHALLSGGGGYHRSAKVDDMLIAHYPVRSKSQIISKALVGWLAHLSNGGRKHGQGYQWKAIYDAFKTEGDIDDDLFYSLGENYANGCSGGLVLDPFPDADSIEIAYAQDQIDCTTNKLLSVAEEFATRIGGEIDGVEPDIEQLGGLHDHGGAWQRELAKRGVECDVAPFRYLRDVFAPTSVLEVGPTVGASLQLFKNWGVGDIRGVDLRQEIGPLFPGMAGHIDSGVDAISSGPPSDLVIHWEADKQDSLSRRQALVEAITRQGKEVLVLIPPACSSEPSLSLDARLALWKGAGWHLLPFQTIGFRTAASMQALKGESLVLVRAGHSLLEKGQASCNLIPTLVAGAPAGAESQVDGGYAPVIRLNDCAAMQVYGDTIHPVGKGIAKALYMLLGGGSGPVNSWIRNRIARSIGS